MNYIYFTIMISGLYSFCSKMKHMLIMLLSLEFMIIGLYIGLFLSLKMFFFSLIFLVFTVCEGALGLSLVVIMSRAYGSDYLFLFNLN